MRKTIYFNFKSPYGTETVDQLNRKNFPSTAAFNREIKRLQNEYSVAGLDVYTSQRATKTWRSPSV